MKIGFLGAGNLGKSMIEGLLNTKKYHKADIKIVIHSDKSYQFYHKEKFLVSKDWNFLKDCKVIILALLPENIINLKNEFKKYFNNQIIISVAAGITLKQLQIFFLNCLITRAMPNTSCQFNQSMTMITKNGEKEANIKALSIFNLLGATVLLNEDKIHTFIAICGSASAYLYYWLQPLMKFALENEFSLEEGKLIITKLLNGVSTNFYFNNLSLEQLQSQVTVPNGTTIEAIKIFDKFKIKEHITKAVVAVAKRSKELE